MIEVRHLRLVAEIARTGNMTRAAARLFLTQPSLSHQLKEIESKLGTALFLRVNKTLVLTPAGERLLLAADEILPKVAQAEDEIRGRKRVSATIRMTTKCYTGYHWLPKLMKEFNREFPEVEFDIVTEAMTQPLEFLLNGKIDVAVTNERPSRKGIYQEKVFDDEMVLLVPTSHRLAKKKTIEPQDFVNEHLIIYKESFAEDFFAASVLIPANVVPARVTKMQLTEARVELVRAGIGITVLSRWLVKPFLQKSSGIAQIRITRKGVYRSWYVACLQQTKDEPYVRKFISFLKDQQLGNTERESR